MNTLDSEIAASDEIPAQERVPLSGEALDSAIKSMESPDFLQRLTASIMYHARKMGFQSPFEDSMDLPGGKSAGDLAGDIIEKALSGAYSWDRQKIPDFTNFCRSRARSILSNWLKRMKHFTAVSPLAEKDPETDEAVDSPITKAVGEDDLYAILRFREGGALGDRFLEDLAWSLPDGSSEQRITLAIFDDRDCGNRAYCRSKLELSEPDYDAAVKRLLRKLPAFTKEWCKKNNVNPEDWKEAR